MNDKLKDKTNDKVKAKDKSAEQDPGCCTAPPDTDPGPIKP